MSLLDRIVAAFKRENPGERLPAPGMDRRRFLQILGSSAAVAAVAPALDLERLLWMPGQGTAPELVAVTNYIEAPSMFAVPPMGRNIFLTSDWVVREAMKMFENNLKLISKVNRVYDGRYSLLVTQNPVATIQNPRWGVDTIGDWQDRIEPELRANARLSDASLPIGAMTSRTLHEETPTARMNAAINSAEGIMAFQMITQEREPARIIITDADLKKQYARIALTDHLEPSLEDPEDGRLDDDYDEDDE